MINISWARLAQVLAGVFALVIAVAGATFAICKLVTEVQKSAAESHIRALQLQVQMLDTRVRELEEELNRLRTLPPKPPEHAQLGTSPKPKENQLSITFDQPKDGASVPQFTDIAYSVTGAMPHGYRPVLIIRDPLGQYWSWGTSPTGRHLRIQVGVDTDSGQPFEIGVLITNHEFPLGQPRQALPEGILYKAITVTRQ